MEIAIINRYQNNVNRGTETYVVELAKRLSKNHQVDILTKINFLKKYDLIIPTNGRSQVFLVRILSWLTGAKMIVSGQSGIGLDDRLNLYAMPNVFITLSTKALNWAKKINPLVKSVYIPNGVDLNRFKIQDVGFKNKRSLTNFVGKIKTILVVGAFTKEKRHDLTIKAVARLKDAKLIIAGGGGSLRKDIEILGEKLLGKDRFEIIETTNDKMPQIYNKANLLVFPTVPWESFGIVLVEAMASGLPVVATDDPIRREIIGDAGLFVDPTDIHKFANTIEKALNTAWGEKPRKQTEKFSWDIIANEYENLFKNI